MAQESWIAPTPRFASVSIADGADLQAQIEVLLALAGWTDEGGGRWKNTPVDGHWIAVTFAQPASDKLSIVCDDYLGRTFPEFRVGTVVAATLYDIFVNPFGAVVSGPADGKWLLWGILDHFPKDQDSHQLDTYACGSKSNADADAGYDVGTIAGPRYDGAISFMRNSRYTTGNDGWVTAILRWINGVRKDAPVLVWAESAGGIFKLAGRMFHSCAVDGALAVGAEIVCIIDEGETAKFRVTRVAIPHASGPRLAMMKEKA